MKKNLLTLTMGCLAALSVAAPRTAQQALLAAQSFMAQRIAEPIALTEVTLRADLAAPRAQRVASDMAPYYVFHDSQHAQMVIVSGTDLMQPIIGYCDAPAQPAPDAELPANLREYLDYVEHAVAYLEEHPEASVAERVAAKSYTPVAPLIKTQWNQDAPYNNLTPLVDGGHTPTGCVATAAAQIMNYWQYPDKGMGEISYSFPKGSIKVDLGEKPFDWKNMLNTYRGISTSAQKDAVAWLMYAVGTSVWMDYDSNGSGSLGRLCAKALVENFGYSSRIGLSSSEQVLFDEWHQRLYEEVTEKRPIMMCAQSMGGGHAFVLDGIDAKGFYHVNWGWGGYYDGYFHLGLLDPSGQGIGGSSTDEGFNFYQMAILNIAPTDAQTGRYVTSIVCESGDGFTPSVSQASASTQIYLKLKATNQSQITATGKCGILIMQDSTLIEKRECDAAKAQGMKIEPPRNGNFYTSQYKMSVGSYSNPARLYFTPGTILSDGTYQLYPYFQPDSCEEYDIIRSSITKKEDFITMVKTGNTCTYKAPAAEDFAGLTYVDTPAQSDTIETRAIKISANVSNIGQTTYVGSFILYMTNQDGVSKLQSEPVIMSFAPGETKTLTFEVSPNKSGKWSSSIYVGSQALIYRAYQKVSNSDRTFYANADNTTGAILSLKEMPTVTPEKPIFGQPCTITAVIGNTGEAFDGNIQVRLFKNSTATTGAVCTYNCRVAIGSGETKTVELVGTPTYDTKTELPLFIRLYGQKGDTWTALTKKATLTGAIFLPEGTSSIEAVTADPATEVFNAPVFDILGHPVAVPADGKLPRGMYIIGGKKKFIL